MEVPTKGWWGVVVGDGARWRNRVAGGVQRVGELRFLVNSWWRWRCGGGRAEVATSGCWSVAVVADGIGGDRKMAP